MRRDALLGLVLSLAAGTPARAPAVAAAPRGRVLESRAGERSGTSPGGAAEVWVAAGGIQAVRTDLAPILARRPRPLPPPAGRGLPIGRVALAVALVGASSELGRRYALAS